MQATPAEAKKLLAAALPLAQEKNSPLNYTAALILGQVAEENKDLAAAEVFFRISMNEAARLQSHAKLLESYGAIIDAFFENKKYADAGRICKELLDLKTDDDKPRIVKRATTTPTGDTDFLEDDSFDAAKRLRTGVIRIYVRTLAKQGKFDQALKLIDGLVKDSSHWSELQLKGLILQEAGKFEEAVKVFETIISRIAKDEDLKAEEREEQLENNRYALSGIFIDMNKVNEAADILQKLIDANPKTPSYYNDLGYVWADHNMKLDEAEKLIRKALELDRKRRMESKNLAPEFDHDSGAYLDSLGWVLFRQKKLNEAKEAFLQAVADKNAQHLEIYDHLGDTLMALGERDAAVRWRRGLEVAGESSAR